VKVAQAVLAVDLDVADRVALAAVSFSAIAPPVLRVDGEIGVVHEGDLILRQWNG
jgi:hypothetical protein